MIEFVIPMNPVAKGRARFSTIHGKAIAFTPKETVVAERTMATFAREAMKGLPLLTGVLSVQIAFFLRKPKSVKREHPTTKPDLDNYVKMLDAFNGVIWQDDSQIVSLSADKSYCTNHEQPRIWVCVDEIMSAKDNGHKKNTIRGKGAKK